MKRWDVPATIAANGTSSALAAPPLLPTRAAPSAAADDPAVTVAAAWSGDVASLTYMQQKSREEMRRQRRGAGANNASRRAQNMRRGVRQSRTAAALHQHVQWQIVFVLHCSVNLYSSDVDGSSIGGRRDGSCVVSHLQGSRRWWCDARHALLARRVVRNAMLLNWSAAFIQVFCSIASARMCMGTSKQTPPPQPPPPPPPPLLCHMLRVRVPSDRSSGEECQHVEGRLRFERRAHRRNAQRPRICFRHRRLQLDVGVVIPVANTTRQTTHTNVTSIDGAPWCTDSGSATVVHVTLT
jgi:hypothetical protein